MLCFCSNTQKLVSQFFFKISRPQTISSAKLFKNLLFKAQHAFSGLTGGNKWRLDSIYDYYQQLALLKIWSYICRITITLSNFLFLRVVELYNYLTIEQGQEIIKNGWAGIRGHTGSVRSVAGSRPNGGLRKFWRIPAIFQCRLRVCRMCFCEEWPRRRGRRDRRWNLLHSVSRWGRPGLRRQCLWNLWRWE